MVSSWADRKNRILLAGGSGPTGGYGGGLGLGPSVPAPGFDVGVLPPFFALFPFNLFFGCIHPHQKAAFYKDPEVKGGIADAKQLHGKELSYNNIVDMEAAWDLASEWKDQPACAIIKHTNPCGCALGENALDAFKKAFAADSKSAFGGIVAMNRECDKATAEEMKPIFFEVVMAPKFSKEALEVLETKKNIRLIEVPSLTHEELQLHKVSGGLLIQTPDNSTETRADCKVVTDRAPTEEEWKALEFAWIIVKHVKSNAIVLTNQDTTLGRRCRQMNRVGSADIAIAEAGRKSEGLRHELRCILPLWRHH